MEAICALDMDPKQKKNQADFESLRKLHPYVLLKLERFCDLVERYHEENINWYCKTSHKFGSRKR